MLREKEQLIIFLTLIFLDTKTGCPVGWADSQQEPRK